VSFFEITSLAPRTGGLNPRSNSSSHLEDLDWTIKPTRTSIPTTLRTWFSAS